MSDKRKQLDALREARLARKNVSGGPSAPTETSVSQRDLSVSGGEGQTPSRRVSSTTKKTRPSSGGPSSRSEVTSRPSTLTGETKREKKTPSSKPSPSTPEAKQTPRKSVPEKGPAVKPSSPSGEQKVKPTTERLLSPPANSGRDLSEPKTVLPKHSTPSASASESVPPQTDPVNRPRNKRQEAQETASVEPKFAARLPLRMEQEENVTKTLSLEHPRSGERQTSTSFKSSSTTKATAGSESSKVQRPQQTFSQQRVGVVSIAPLDIKEDNSSVSQTKTRTEEDRSPRNPPRTTNGFELLRSLDTAAAGNENWTSSASAQCCFNAKWIFGGETRMIMDVTVGRMPYTPNGIESPHCGTAVCVVSSYSSAVKDIFGGDGGVSLPVNGANLAEILDISSGNQASTEAGLTDYGFNWGSYDNGSSAFGNIAGSLTSREWSIERVASLSKSAPGLVMAWIAVPIAEDGNDEMEGYTASRMVVATPLVCDSEVTSVVIHPFKPNTVFGGTRSGRIVCWNVGSDVLSLDARQLRTQAAATSGSKHILVTFPRRPSFSTFPSPQAHQSPVLRIAVLGDPSSHHLYSMSQDGKVCTWSAWQALHPLSSRMAYIGNKTMGSVGTCASFSSMKGSDAMSRVIIGTTSGALLSGRNRDARVLELAYLKGSPATGTTPAGAVSGRGGDSLGTSGAWGRAGETQSVSMNSDESSKPNLFSNTTSCEVLHGGIVNAVTVQPQVIGLRDAECVLSAASDGSCFAWLDDNAVRLEGFGDVVCSLEWSPALPTLFAAGDASGTLTLWDVSQSITTPIASVSLTHHLSAHISATPASTLIGIRKGATELRDGYDDDGDDTVHFSKTEQREKEDGNAEVSSRITSIHFSSNGRWIFVGTAAGFVYVVELSKEFHSD